MTISPTGSSNGASSGSSSSSSSNGVLSSNDFLSLLVSELQNQDPMNATSVTDFINQMTSYVNVESQQAINTSLGSLAGSFGSLVTLRSIGTGPVGATTSRGRPMSWWRRSTRASRSFPTPTVTRAAR